ncbi:aminotransferase class III-fold pyridoxal phosphate-dependent enzyme [Rhodobacteraceae bacterium]|nr:aminotransferase class III-fold pyridoxal phosphate-dependent enzyme [Paracoccaceae bacterium]
MSEATQRAGATTPATTSGRGVWVWDEGGGKLLDCDCAAVPLGHGFGVRTVKDGPSGDLVEKADIRDLAASLGTALRAPFGADPFDVSFFTDEEIARQAACQAVRDITGQRGIVVIGPSVHDGRSALQGDTYGVVALDAACDDAPLSPSKCLGDLEQAIETLHAAGHGLAGVIVHPDYLPAIERTFLPQLAARVRHAGGRVIADESDSGFGRMGRRMWGWQQFDCVPDIAIVGAGLGNGAKIAALVHRAGITIPVTSPAPARDAFLAGLSVCATLKDPSAIAHVDQVGAFLHEKLCEIRHPLMGRVTGQGLIVSVAFAPNGHGPGGICAEVQRGLRAHGLLVGRRGEGGSTLRICPPLMFSRQNAATVVEMLSEVLLDMPHYDIAGG